MSANTEITVKKTIDLWVSAVVEHSQNAIIGIDLNGFISYWNPGAEQLYGYTMNEVVGMDYSNYMPDDHRGEFRKVFEKVRRGRRVPSYESIRRHRNGNMVDINVSVHPVRDNSSNIIGLCEVDTDITRLKKTERDLQASNAEIEAVVQTVLDGIVAINEHGIISSVNPAAEEIFGYHAHEMIGVNVNMLMPEPYHTEHDGYLIKYKETGKANIIGVGREVEGKRKNGNVFPVDLAVTEMIVDGRKAYVGILRDITARKEAEDRLRELNRQYQDKATELSEAMEQLRNTQDQLVQSEKLASLGGLVAGVAHEINTPVGVCVTASSFLHGRTEELLNCARSGKLKGSDIKKYLTEAAESTDLIMRNLKRASELVSSFKQVAVDRSANETRIIKIGVFLDDVVTSLNPVLKPARHIVEISGDLEQEIQTNPGALSQVMTNLLMNAVTHGYDEGVAGHITISAETVDETVKIEVKDNGSGIDDKNIDKIFDPFFTTARHRGGTGLGLHVVHNLITEVLGGEISVESEAGKGCSFYLTLPLSAAS